MCDEIIRDKLDFEVLPKLLQINQDEKEKHTNIKTVYKDNKNWKYLQKYFKQQAEWLWCKGQVVQLK